MILDYVIVFILSMLAGGWSVAAGVLLGLDPVGVYLVTVSGSAILAVLLLIVGGRVRTWVTERYFPGADERVAGGRAAAITRRWGEPGLAIVGAAVLGPTPTLIAAVVIGVDRRRFLAWYIGGTVVSFALLTLLWTLIV